MKRWGGIANASQGENAASSYHRLLLVFLPAALSVLVYSNTLFLGLTYDDQYIFEWAEYGTEQPSRRLLTYLTYSFDGWLWGDWVPGYHLTNLILHATASSLAARSALLLSRSSSTALMCGILFAVHPVHVEAVASIANRADILAMIFLLLSLNAWIGSSARPAGYIRSLYFMVFAVISKSVAAIGFAPMLFIADILLIREQHGSFGEIVRRSLLRCLPLCIIGAAAIYFFAEIGLGHFGSLFITRVMEGNATSYREVVSLSLASVPDAFRLLLFPVSLSADYPVQARELGDAQPLFGLALALLWLVIAAVSRRRSPLLSFAVLWTLVTYLPLTNVFPLIHFFLADRFLYVPSFGICLMLALGFAAVLNRSRRWGGRLGERGVIALSLLLVSLASTRVVVRNLDWRDNTTLGLSAIAAGYETWRMREAVAEGLIDRGDYLAAEPYLRRAIELQPGAPHLRYILAASLVTQGRVLEAKWQVERATPQLSETASSETSYALYLLAEAFLGMGDPDNAMRQLRHSLEVDATPALRARTREAMVWILATSPSLKRNGLEATQLAQELLSQKSRVRPRVHAALAASQAEAGQFKAARRTAGIALRLARDHGNERVVLMSRGMLKHFEMDLPYRLSSRELFHLLRESRGAAG